MKTKLDIIEEKILQVTPAVKKNDLRSIFGLLRRGGLIWEMIFNLTIVYFEIQFYDVIIFKCFIGGFFCQVTNVSDSRKSVFCPLLHQY